MEADANAQYSKETFHRILDDIENGDGLYEYDENDDLQNDMTRHVSWLFNKGYLEYNEGGGTISGLSEKGVAFLDELGSEMGVIRTSDGFTFFRTDAPSANDTALNRCIERLERNIAIASDEGRFHVTEDGDVWRDLSDGRFDHLRKTMVDVLVAKGFTCAWDERGLHVMWIQTGDDLAPEDDAPRDPFAEAEMESAQASAPAAPQSAPQDGEVQIDPSQFTEQEAIGVAAEFAPNSSSEMKYLKYLSDGK